MNTLFKDNSIGELIAKFARKELHPSDAYAAALENIRELDPKYFAWVAYGDDAAVERIKLEEETFGVDPDRLLEGIPVGSKISTIPLNFRPRWEVRFGKILLPEMTHAPCTISNGKVPMLWEKR